MSRFPEFYDEEKRECKICGMLLQPDPKFVEAHAKETYHIKMALEKTFGKPTIIKEEKMILNKIQKELKAPKNQMNTFGNYKYRSCEDILEAVKPLLGEATLTLSDEIVLVGDRYYVKATATIISADGCFSSTAYARESLDKKGMDTAQITGAASSYARKYALNGLFCIDDTKDADTEEHHPQKEEPIQHTSTEKPTKTGTDIHYETLISPAQGKRLYAIRKQSGIPDQFFMDWLMENYGIDSDKQITKETYEDICTFAQGYKK